LCSPSRLYQLISITWTKKMHYFLLIYFNSRTLHVSSRLATHHQEVQPCINSKWYNHVSCWLYQLLFIQSWCSWRWTASLPKHVEAYYWNKLMEDSVSSWFMLYRYITMHGQQSVMCTNWCNIKAKSLPSDSTVIVIVIKCIKVFSIIKTLLYKNN
jgi:hypothetical protein